MTNAIAGGASVLSAVLTIAFQALLVSTAVGVALGMAWERLNANYPGGGE